MSHILYKCCKRGIESEWQREGQKGDYIYTKGERERERERDVAELHA